MRPPSTSAWSLDTPQHRARRFEATADDGTVLRGITAGPEDGPPIVFAHCWTGNWTVWEPVAARLAATHRVVLWDHRDHGASDTSASPASIELLGGDVIAVMDHLGIDRAVLAGHSMGGMASLVATLDHPERVEALGLFSTSAEPSAWPRHIARALPLICSVVESTWSEGRINRALVRPTLGRRPGAEAIARTRQSYCSTPGPLRGEWIRAISRFDVHHRLHEIDVPTLVAGSRRDTLLGFPHTVALAEGLPTASLTVLPGAGHMTPLERPDALADLLTSLSRTDTQPTRPPSTRTPILQGAHR